MRRPDEIDETKADLQERMYAWPYHFFLAPPGGRQSLADELHYLGAIDCALDLLMPLRGKSVLDAGCGEGRVTWEVVRRGARVQGVDLSERAITMARMLVPDAQFTVGSLTDLNHLDDDFFDEIVLMEVLEHLPPEERRPCLQELRRVLKSDGKLVVSVPSDRVPVEEKHYQHFSPKSLSETLAGLFHVERVVGCHRKAIWYSIFVRAFDNSFWTVRAPLEALYRRFVQVCSVEKGVQLVALCTPSGSEGGEGARRRTL